MRALVLAAMLWPGAAHAGDLCAAGARHRGTLIDLDVQAADVRDVMRLIAQLAHVNLVVGDDVSAKVTLALHDVPWDAATCTIARVHHLAVAFDDGVLVVTKAR
jgi:type II secretory pathway component HofQ